MEKSLLARLKKRECREEINDLLRKVKLHKRVYLYGAGKVAAKIIKCFNLNKIDNIEAVIVSDGHKKNSFFMGFDVREISQVQFYPGDCIVLSVIKRKANDLRKQLELIDIPEGVSIYEQEIVKSVSSIEEFYKGSCTDGPYFREFLELNEIGSKYGTDKAEKFHNYLHKYEFFLSKYKSKPIRLMELGVFNGASIKMWADYFRNGQIIGVDIDESCLKFKGDNYKCIQKDLSKPNALQELSVLSPTIIIDDASHMWSHQIMALCMLFPKLQSGGCYIIEDIGTSFGMCKYMYFGDASISAYEFLSAICELVAGKESSHSEDSFIKEEKEIAEQIDMITFIYGSCIIVKR